MRIIRELTDWYTSNTVLDGLGIRYGYMRTKSTKRGLDARRIDTPRDPQHTFVIPEFEADKLNEALSELPDNFDRTKCLRVLQYIHEIGKPQVLLSLQTRAIQPAEGMDLDMHAIEKIQVEKLASIHEYLDRECENHISISRSLYVKFCYYKTFEEAVGWLQGSLEKRRKEQNRTRKNTSSTLPTPVSDKLKNLYPDIGKNGVNAKILVTNNIVRQHGRLCDMPTECHGCTQCEPIRKLIKEKVKAYLKDGETIGWIFQGMDPGLLTLFPSAPIMPSLNVDHCGNAEELQKPIGIKE